MYFAIAEVSGDAVYLGAAAVVSAVVAAGVAIWRTRALLASERERLSEQLAHDRAQRERQELRNVIDETIRAIHNCVYRVIEAQEAIKRKARGDDVPDSAYKEPRDGASDLLRRINGFQSRLAIRLKPNAALPQAAKECREKLWMATFLADQAWPDSNKEDRAELLNAIDEATEKTDAFDDVARTLAQSVLDVE